MLLLRKLSLFFRRLFSPRVDIEAYRHYVATARMLIVYEMTPREFSQRYAEYKVALERVLKEEYALLQGWKRK